MSDFPMKMWLWHNGFLGAWQASDIHPAMHTVATKDVVRVLVYPADQAPEPVAVIEKRPGYYDIEDLPSTEETLPEGRHFLYLAPPAAEQIRAEEREKWATAMESFATELAIINTWTHGQDIGKRMLEAIRSMGDE
jgi:hypothetical protein